MSKSNSTLARPSHSQTVEVMGLKGLMTNLNTDVVSINSNLKHFVEQGDYDFYGKNNELILDSTTGNGVIAYADSVPAPQKHPDNKQGWYYVNENQGNKFNYYFFSGEGYTVKLSDIKGQYCVFQNEALTTSNVNVILAIYGGDFFTGPRRTYSSNIQLEPGVKYLAYWGEDPGIFKELPRIEYTLYDERNWDGEINVSTMSVGSDTAYTALSVKNLMTHVGYISDKPTTTRLIDSIKNINPLGQIALNTSSILTTGINSILIKLQELIDAQSGGGGGGGGGGTGGTGGTEPAPTILT